MKITTVCEFEKFFEEQIGNKKSERKLKEPLYISLCGFYVLFDSARKLNARSIVFMGYRGILKSGSLIIFSSRNRCWKLPVTTSTESTYGKTFVAPLGSPEYYPTINITKLPNGNWKTGERDGGRLNVFFPIIGEPIMQNKLKFGIFTTLQELEQFEKENKSECYFEEVRNEVVKHLTKKENNIEKYLKDLKQDINNLNKLDYEEVINS